MLSFIQYISEVKLNSSGQKSDYDSNKYIKPFVSGQPAHTSGSHEVDRDIGHLKANDKVTLHAHKVIDGVHHVVVSKPGSSNRITITTNKIKKQSFAKNIGFVNCIIKKIQIKRIIEINVMFSFINSLDDIYKLIVYFFFMIIA